MKIYIVIQEAAEDDWYFNAPDERYMIAAYRSEEKAKERCITEEANFDSEYGWKTVYPYSDPDIKIFTRDGYTDEQFGYYHRIIIESCELEE